MFQTPEARSGPKPLLSAPHPCKWSCRNKKAWLNIYCLGRQAPIRPPRSLGATQAAGLTGSFATPGKPFHAGKAAINGVLAAQMADEGFEASLDLIEPNSGLDRALVQDQSVRIHDFDFEEGWEITRNTFKPYASCLLTHPVIDAGRRLAASVDLSEIEKIKVRVHPLAIQLAGKPDPQTPFEGKFSLAFCAALSLAGQAVTQLDLYTRSNCRRKTSVSHS